MASSAAELVVRDGLLRARRADGGEVAVTGACLSLTSRCNEDCVFCMEQRDPRCMRDLPLEQAVALAAPFCGHVPLINASASETLLHPAFLEFAREVSRRGSAVGVVTNGLALARPGFLEQCVEAGLRQVMVSCHTAEPATFDSLTRTRGQFQRLSQALERLEAHNRQAPPARRVRVIVEVVLMRHLEREAKALVEWILQRLGWSRPLLRVETYRPLNAGAARTDLQPDLDQVAALVGRLRTAVDGRLPLELRFVPLCLLPGFEHLAGEVGAILRGERTWGNRCVDDLALVEVAVPGNACCQPAWHGTCGACPLAVVCPGVHDIPARPDGLQPHVPATPLEQVAARLEPPIPPDALARLLPEVERERRAWSGPEPCFDPPSARALSRVAEHLRGKPVRVEFRPDAFVVHLPDVAQPGGTAQVVVSVATEGEVCHARHGVLAIRFNGVRSPRIDAMVRALQALLAEDRGMIVSARPGTGLR